MKIIIESPDNIYHKHLLRSLFYYVDDMIRKGILSLLIFVSNAFIQSSGQTTEACVYLEHMADSPSQGISQATTDTSCPSQATPIIKLSANHIKSISSTSHINSNSVNASKVSNLQMLHHFDLRIII